MDFAIRNQEPPDIIATSSQKVKELYARWHISNRLCIFFIKTRILSDIRAFIDHIDKVQDLINGIDDQFISS